MKTTIDIADHLLVEAKERARKDRTTLRSLVEEGLRRVLEQRRKPVEFRLRDASFRGEGLNPEVGSWEEIRDRIYKGRGS